MIGIIVVSLWLGLAVQSSLALGQRANNFVRLPIDDANDRVFVPISAGRESSHTWVGEILADGRGFLWFSTRNDVERFDGYEMRHYNVAPQESSTGVFVQECCRYALYRDRSGPLWIGSNDSLSRYDPETDKSAPVSLPMQKLQGLIRTINQDRSGALWLSTSRGLTEFNAITGKVQRFEHTEGDASSLASNYVRSTLETREGAFWVATNVSVDLFDRITGKVGKHFMLRNPLQSASDTGNPFVHLLEDQTGCIWVASARDGLAFIDTLHDRLTFLSLTSEVNQQPGAWAMLEDHQGILWVGTDRGLFRLDSTRRRLVRYLNNPADPDSIPADWVLALYEDREGGIWVGTANAGVARFVANPLPFRRYRRGPNVVEPYGTNYVLSAFEERPNVVWAGTKGAINRIDLGTGEYTVQPIPENTEVGAIAEDKSGALWFGTYDGSLFRFDQKTHKFSVYRHNASDNSGCGNNEVRVLMIDQRGTLWAGSGSALCSYDPALNRFHAYQIGGQTSEIDALAEAHGGILWVGSRRQGLFRFDMATGETRNYRHSAAPDSLSNDGVTSILVDRSGYIWAGTLGGLDRLDVSTGRFTIYRESEGLPSRSINGVLEDESGDLWITTNYGLSHFRRKSKTFYNYYRSDGVYDDLTGAWKGNSGIMLFGSYSGLTTLPPLNVDEARPEPPPVVLTALRISDVLVPVGEDSPLKESISFARSLVLPFDKNNLSLEFSALSFADPANTRYRYKMEALESSWNEVGSTQRLARYTSLAPGKYMFRVEGLTSHGVWSKQGAAFQISILPPWWSTWWFKGICILLFMLAVQRIYRFRVLQVARQMDMRYQERLRERTRIAQDLHDTLLQNIAGLCLQIGGLAKVISSSPEAAKRTLKELRQQSEECLREGRQAVWNIRSLETESVDVANELRQSIERLTAGTQVRCRFKVEGEPLPIAPTVQEHLLRIGREAIINAVRHANASEIQINIIFGTGAVTVRISDNGVGFELEQANRLTGHFGLVTMRERAREIKAQLSVSSEPGRGTAVELKLPAAKAL